MQYTDKKFDTLMGLSYVDPSLVTLTPAYGGVGMTLLSGGELIPVYFTPGTGKWKESSTWERPGVIWSQSLSVSCPSEDITFFYELQRLANKPWILILEFREGKKLWGTHERGVKLNVETNDESGMGISLWADYQSIDKTPWLL